MATKRIPLGEQSTVKVRIIDFEMSGSDQSLQESLQTIAAAFSGGNQRVQVSRALPTGTPTSNDKAHSKGSSNEPAVDGDEIEQGEDVQDVQPRAVSSAQRRPVKAVTVKVLTGINFTDTDPTLQDFYKTKNPTSELAKYLVVAYWYKHTRGISNLTVDHFHTAFRALKLPTPKDALQPLRDLRANRNGKMQTGDVKGTFAIHHLGETAVEQMGNGD